MKLLLPIAALILPFVIWPIEIFLPYPYLIEEIAKGILIFSVLKEIKNPVEGVRISLILGMLFALSESVLYIFNIQLVGDLSTFLLRLAVTIPFHAFTSVVIFIFAYSKKITLALFGITIAVVLHFLFNSLIRYLMF